jgi:2-polyprenyl-3-methyl-5-hydroxy-6-metoxy-1,4-benzoquinol methylase
MIFVTQQDNKISYWAKETLKYKTSHARLSIIVNIVKGIPGLEKKILDIGAGPGTLGKLLPEEFKYFGLDITGVKDNLSGVQYCDFDQVTDSTNVVGAPFDIVIISGVLEYLIDWKRFIGIVSEHWLKPSGYLLVSFINNKFYRQHKKISPHPKWKNLYDLPEVMEWIEENDFTINQIFPLFKGTKSFTNPLSYWMSWSKNCSFNPNRLNRSWISQYLFFLQRR